MQKFGRLAVLFFCMLMFLIQLPTTGQNKKYFVITGKIVPEIETKESGTIDILKGTSATKVDIPQNGRFRLELEYFNEYTLTFSLAGHFSKTIIVSTEIPQEVWKRDNDFPPFPMIVQLFKEIEGIDKSFTLKPSGRVFYGKQTDNFEKESIFNDIQIAEQIQTATTQSGQVKKEAQTITKQEALELAAKQKNFDQLISDADISFKKGDYPLALTKYQEAKKLFPEKAYANDRIAELQDLLKALQLTEKRKTEIEQNYKNTIARANTFFDQKTYKEARSIYQEALQFKPEDVFASGRIQEIDQLLAQATQQEKEFNQTILDGDNLAKQKDFLQAINLYKKALGMKPDNKLATDKIAETEKAIAVIENDKNYQENIRQADQALAGNDLQNAKMFYQVALKLKSSETYPKNKLAEIALTETNETKFIELLANAEKTISEKNYDESVNLLGQALQLKPKNAEVQKRIDEVQILKKQQATEKEFDQAILLGDQQKTQGIYDKAISSYRDALKIKPNNELALGKISDVEQILAGLEKDKQYQAIIASADKSFDKKDYAAAQTDYRKSLTYKPAETYPASRIKEIDQILEQEKQAKLLEDNFKAVVARADKAFGSQSYDDARKIYTEALTIKPNEAYPTAQISKIDGILAEKARLQQIENDFLALVGKGDAAFDQKDYEVAKTNYTNALGIKPNAADVKTKIKNIDDILKKLADDKKKEEERQLAEAAKEKAYNDAIASADKSFDKKDYAAAQTDYRKSLTYKPTETYPTSRIKEIDNILQKLADDKKKEEERQLAEAAKEKAYNDAIASADKSFDKKDYAAAQTDYRKSLTYKPAETYPANRIKEIDQILEQEKQAKLLEDNFKAVIARADKAFGSQSYDDARKIYTEALTIKPNEAYPTGQISKIDGILAEKARLQQIENDFLALVGKGDAAFDQKDYEVAKTNYTNALGIKPNAADVKIKIKNIDDILKKLADDKKKEEERQLAEAAKEKAYNEAIASADKSFDKKDYAAAQTDYRKSLTYKPAETYPTNRIKEIDQILEQEKQAKLLEDNFKAVIARADKAFGSEKYDDARKIYTEALTIKPNEAYPTGQISKIDGILAEKARLQQIENDFLALVGKGDAAFDQKDYEVAKTNYTNALGIKPNAADVKTKIKNIDDILKKLADDKKKEEERQLAEAAKEKAYNEAIASADKSFDKKDYAAAQTDYRKSLTYKPAETYPANRIKEIDQILEQEKQAKLLEDNFKAVIARADKAFGSEKYDDARKIYTEALTIKPNEAYPTGQISKIDGILAEKARLQQIENDFLALVGKGDAAFDQKDYEVAKTNYTNALGIKPNAADVKTKIKNIDDILKKLADDKKKEEERQLAEAAKEKAYNDAIASADKSFDQKDYAAAQTDYRKSLTYKPAETYPTNRIKEIDSILLKLADDKKKEEERQLAEAAKEKAYNDAIASADKSFDQKDYAAAQTDYRKSLTYKPAETYPTNRIKEIDSILLKLADDKKKEEERQLAEAAKEKAYNDAIASADKSFDKKDYAAAQTDYRKSLTYKPEETYPTSRIKEIDSILMKLADDKKKEEERQLAEAAKEKAYNDAIASADKSFEKKDYTAAQTDYRKSLTYKPEETYPTSRIKEIDSILMKLADDKKKEEERQLAEAAKEKAYNDAIASADKSFDNKDYTAAQTDYRKSLTYKPEETYPTSRIKEIDSILMKLADDKKKEEERQLAEAAKEKAYNDAIASADKSFDKKDYAAAQTDYRKSLAYKPEETYPTSRIKEIDSILMKLADDKKKEEERQLAEAAKEKAYNDAIARADKAFGTESYDDARKIYTEALTIKPNEAYPTGQISKIDGILADKAKLQQIENDFLALVGKGDAAFDQKDYEVAKTNYTNALGIKPNAADVKTKIKNIDDIMKKLADDKKKEEQRLLALAAATEKAYTDAIDKGTKQIAQKTYSDARVTFQEAKKLKPSETLPDEMIAKIDSLISGNERELADARLKEEAYQKSLKEAKEKAFNEAMAKADKSFNENDFKSAKTGYEAALVIKAADPTAKEKLGLTEAKLAELAKLTQAYNTAITAANKFVTDKRYPEAKEKYEEALQYIPDSDYPKSQIEKLNALLAQAEAELQKEKLYASSMKEGETLFTAKDYSGARPLFAKASELKPAEPMPISRMKEIDKILNDLALKESKNKTIESSYLESIKRADTAFANKEYSSARLIYGEALSIKPNEKYPKDQIALIDKLMTETQPSETFADKMPEEKTVFPASQPVAQPVVTKPIINPVETAQATEARAASYHTVANYDEAIRKADDSFGVKDYTVARFFYYKANELKPNEDYPKKQIELIRKLVDAGLSNNDLIGYEQAITQADEAFKKETYNVAKFFYNKALEIKSWEKYPKDRIQEILALTHSMLSEKEEKAYRDMIAKADEALVGKDISIARFYYNKAMTIKKDENYPRLKLKDIQKLVDQDKLDQHNQEYNKIIEQADEAFKSGDFSMARFNYNKALTMKPDEKYPKDQLKRIRESFDKPKK
jgi:tetratricopeptide (TPR) repeat protein